MTVFIVTYLIGIVLYYIIARIIAEAENKEWHRCACNLAAIDSLMWPFMLVVLSLYGVKYLLDNFIAKPIYQKLFIKEKSFDES
jgi:hypothetical protein